MSSPEKTRRSISARFPPPDSKQKKTARVVKLGPRIRKCFSNVPSAVLCHFHARDRKSRLCPGAILRDAIPAVVAACCLSASAAEAGSLAAEVPAAIPVAAAGPAASPARALNPAAHYRENCGSSDAAPAHCDCCCCCPAADVYTAHSTAAAPVACSSMVAEAAFLAR